MSAIYTVISQKGSVGKSTTALALTAGLARQGYRTMAVDLDAQENFSYTAGASMDGPTVLELLTGEISASQAVQHTAAGDVIAASRALAGADGFLTETGKEYWLKEALEEVQRAYDYRSASLCMITRPRPM